MSLLKSLFAETANNKIKKRHLKRLSKIPKFLNDAEKFIPKMDYPKVGTKEHNDDMGTQSLKEYKINKEL